ncbi:MAG TPA: hypothetical protein VHV55_19175 [Pirellulales bacterium]|nr:hypothetical protein [Pirellulales bacterium]
MADGHHYIPQSFRRAIAKLLSAEAERVFKKQITTNPYSEWHGNSREHMEYNDRVAILVRNHISGLARAEKLVGGKLTRDQAEYIVARIKKDGFGDRKVYEFNQNVLQSLRLLALGSIVARGLGEFKKIDKLDRSVEVKRYYNAAAEALTKGDWRAADRAVRGGGGVGSGANNLLNAILLAGYEKEALILQDRWKARVEQFRTIERGNHVDGVPDGFEAFERG